jgi:WD40 repeat protein
VQGVAWSSDGHYLAAGSGVWDLLQQEYKAGVVVLWDAKTGREIRLLKGMPSSVVEVAFCPEKPLLAAGGEDGQIQLWDVTEEKPPLVLSGHDGRITRLAFHPRKPLLFSAATDGLTRVWKLETGELVHTLKSAGKSVLSMAVTADGQRLMTGAEDGMVRFFEPETGELLLTLPAHPEHVSAIAHDPQGQILATNGNGRARLWDISSPCRTTVLDGHQDYVESACFSSSGRIVASGGSQGKIKLWSSETGSELKTLKGHTARVETLVFNEAGTQLASGDREGNVAVWDVKDGSRLLAVKPSSSSVTSLVFSHEGSILISGFYNGSLAMLDARTGEKKRELIGHRAAIASLRFAREEDRFISADWTGRTLSWTREGPCTPASESSLIGEDRWSRDGQWFLISNRINLQVVPFDEGKRLAPLDGSLHLAEYRRCVREKEWSGAIFHLDRIIAENPLMAWSYADRADMLLNLNRPHEALREVFHASFLMPAGKEDTYWSSGFGSVDVAAQREDWERVAVITRRSLRYSVFFHETWQQSALAELACGRKLAYRKQCERVLKVAGDNADATVAGNLAWMCSFDVCDSQTAAKALDLAERALKEGKTPIRHHFRAFALYRLGRFEEARQEAEAVVRSMNDQPYLETMGLLALTHFQLGQGADAATWSRRFERSLSQAKLPGWQARLRMRLLRDEVREVVRKPMPEALD